MAYINHNCSLSFILFVMKINVKIYTDLQEITNIEGLRNVFMKDLQEMERVLAGRCVPMRDIGLMENSLSARNIDMKDLECLQTI